MKKLRRGTSTARYPRLIDSRILACLGAASLTACAASQGQGPTPPPAMRAQRPSHSYVLVAGDMTPTTNSHSVESLRFAPQKSRIQPQGKVLIETLAQIIRSTPEVRRIHVEGHTDSRGVPDENRALSRQRAEAVRRALIEAGVPPEQLEIIGYGDTRPIASNRTARGRAQNRQVSFTGLK